jgi:hypothetical protein
MKPIAVLGSTGDVIAKVEDLMSDWHGRNKALDTIAQALAAHREASRPGLERLGKYLPRPTGSE